MAISYLAFFLLGYLSCLVVWKFTASVVKIGKKALGTARRLSQWFDSIFNIHVSIAYISHFWRFFSLQ